MLLPNRPYGPQAPLTSFVRKQGSNYTITGQFMCIIATSLYSGPVSL